MWCAPAARAASHRLRELLRPVGEARQDRRERDARADPRVDEAAHDLEPAARRRRIRLRRPPDALVERRHRDVDRHLGAHGGLLQHVDVAPHERPAGDQRHRRAGAGELDDAGAREPVAPLRRLVRVGGGAERHLLALPRAACELPAQHLRHVHLHPDRAAVAVVRGPVGARLERADVTEGAPMHAPGVRVQRPGERHPPDPVQGAAAGLLEIGRAHRCRIEHLFVFAKRGCCTAAVRRARCAPCRRRRCRSSPRRSG